MTGTETKPAPPSTPRWKLAAAGVLAGVLAGIAMTAVMSLLASMFGIATPLVLVGDRISVFLPVDTFLALMGKVGGYNRMKQLGVSSVIIGRYWSEPEAGLSTPLPHNSCR